MSDEWMIHRVKGWKGLQTALSRTAWAQAIVGALAFAGAMIMFAPEELTQNAYLCTIAGTLGLALLHASSEEGLSAGKNRTMSMDNIVLLGVLGPIPGAVVVGIAEIYLAFLSHGAERAAYVASAVTGFALFSAWTMCNGVAVQGRSPSVEGSA